MAIDERFYRFKNFARSTLGAALSASATQLRVEANHGDRFPALEEGEIFTAILTSGSLYEIAYCTARGGDFLTVERGREGTTAQDFPAGASVVNQATAGFFEQAQNPPGEESLMSLANKTMVGHPSASFLRYELNSDVLGPGIRGGGVNYNDTALEFADIVDADDEYLTGWQDGDFPIEVGAEYEVRWQTTSGALTSPPASGDDFTPLPENTWSFSEWEKALALYDNVVGWQGAAGPVFGHSNVGSGQAVIQVEVRKIDLTDGPVSATITFGDLPPVIDSLSPPTLEEDGGAFTLTVTGQNFQANSVVRWDGADRTTVFNSATELEASILAGDVDDPGTFDVTVYNATSDQESAAEPFEVTEPVFEISITNRTVSGIISVAYRLNSDFAGGFDNGGMVEQSINGVETAFDDEFLVGWQAASLSPNVGDDYEFRFTVTAGSLDLTPLDDGFNALPENTWSFSEWSSAWPIFHPNLWFGSLNGPTWLKNTIGTAVFTLEIRRIDLTGPTETATITLTRTA